VIVHRFFQKKLRLKIFATFEFSELEAHSELYTKSKSIQSSDSRIVLSSLKVGSTNRDGQRICLVSNPDCNSCAESPSLPPQDGSWLPSSYEAVLAVQYFGLPFLKKKSHGRHLNLKVTPRMVVWQLPP
jgi:hypothetical protein